MASALSSTTGRWIVAVTVAGSSMAFLDSTVLSIAMPDIGRDLGADTNSLQWVTTGYLLSLVALILVGGALGDTYGRRRIFEVGVLVFCGASVLLRSALPGARPASASASLTGRRRGGCERRRRRTGSASAPSKASAGTEWVHSLPIVKRYANIFF